LKRSLSKAQVVSILGEYTTSGTAVSVPLGTTRGDNYSSIALGSQFSPAPSVTVDPGTPTAVGTSGPTSSYSSVAPVKVQGGLGTTLSLIGGTNQTGNAQNVTLATTNLGSRFTSLASDVVSVSGNDGSIFALQLTFDLNAANQVGGADNMSLLYYTENSGWELANAGDHGTNDASGSELDFNGSFTAFQQIYGTDLGLYLGAYGVDTTSDTVWAVIDHNSDFGVADQSDLPEAVPEPCTWSLLLGGLGVLGFFSLRTRRASV
jgi:hypothetical protein